jgi:hypothetical protein
MGDANDPELPLTIALALGELKGQVMSLTEAMNRKTDTESQLVVAVTQLQAIPTQIAGIKQDISSIETRLTQIEARNLRQDGAATLGSLVVKSPIVGWLVATATALWAILGPIGER